MSAPRVGLVGAGHMGRYHARKLAELAALREVEFAGIADRDIARARALARATGTRAVASNAQLFAAAEAVIVAVPTLEHFDVVNAALCAGLDVLVEKPIAATLAEAESLLEVARARGRVLRVGAQEWHSPALRAARSKLQQPRYVECLRVGPFSERGSDVDVVRDLMIHDLDILQRLFGAEPERIDATGVQVVTDKVDVASARLVFPGGCVANLTANRVAVEPRRWLRLFQRDGSLSVDFIEQTATIFRRVEARRGEPPRVESEALPVEVEDALIAQLRAFVTAVVSNDVRTSSGDEAREALRTALRVVAAMPRGLEPE